MKNTQSKYSSLFCFIGLLLFVFISCNNNSSLLNQAQELYSHGEYERALKLADSLTGIDNNNMAAVRLKGFCNIKLGDYNEALQNMNVACNYNHVDTAAYIARADLLYTLRNPQMALKDYKYVLSMDSKNVYVLNCMFFIYYKSHHIDSAAWCVNHALLIDTNYGFSYCSKGLMLMDSGYNQKAIQYYDKAIQKGFNGPSVYFRRATSYKLIGSFKLALEDFDRAIKILPYDTNYHFQRGLVFDTLNMHDSACTDWAIAIANGCVRAKSYLGKRCK